MDEKFLGKNIARLRCEFGFTQEQLASRLGVTAAQVDSWESGSADPDASILPSIARVFNVTTDELLGFKAMKEADKPEKPVKNYKHHSYQFNSGVFGSIFFSVMLIIIGTALLLSYTDIWPFESSFNFWNLVWPAAILGIGLSGFIKTFSFWSLCISLSGLYFLLANLGIIDLEFTWPVFFSVFIIFAGIYLLIRGIFRRSNKSHNGFVYSSGKDPFNNKKHSEFSSENGYVRYECAFCDETRKINTETITGGDIEVAFGKSVLDLTACRHTSSGATLKTEVAFGSIEILLPKCIRVESSGSERVFGSIKIIGEASPDAADILYLRDETSFSGVTVRYV